MLPPAARVLIYDASNLQCELLAAGLESLRPGLEVKCVCDCESMLTVITTDPAWVVVVSDHANGGAFSSLAKRLNSQSSGLPLVFLLHEGSTERVIEALRLGATGIVYSSDNLAQLASCIDRVSQGQVWLKHANFKVICENLSKPGALLTDASWQTLSPREEEISCLVAEGMSNRDVSQTLKITESTVKNTIFRIYEKLGVSNRVELALRMSGTSGVASISRSI
jgi:DNA-binding NarL/FixJ family response regulator